MISIIELLLEKYYNLKDISFYEDKLCTIIEHKNETYFLYLILDLNKAREYYQLSHMVNYCNQIIKNIFGEITTTIEKNNYLLIKKIPHISIQKLISNYYYVNKKAIKLNWKYLWIEKHDYMEKYYSIVRGKYPIIDESMPYYLSMLEFAIYLLKEFENYSSIGYIQHKIMSNDQYFNPLNLIIDFKERDIAEYLKYIFFNNRYQEIDIRSILMIEKNTLQYELIIARLLLPNYYFNIVDEIIMEKENEELLKEIVLKNKSYINFIKRIIKVIETIQPIKKYPI